MAVLLTILWCGAAAFGQTTAFTYQGKLTDGAAAASGTYDLGFALFDAETNGTQVGAAVTRSNVTVSGGIFTVQLDFGANPFAAGANRFLQIAVKKTTETNFTTLAPRQQLTASPYSIRTLSSSAADALSNVCDKCVNDAQINSVAARKITGSVPNADNATTAATAGNVTGIVQIANGGTGSSTQNFVDLTTAQTVAGAKTFADNLRANGLIRVGSETGTTNAPTVTDSSNNEIYNGLVVRRINSTSGSAGDVAARTNYLRLERDGTDGGWRIANDALPGGERQTIHCLGITSGGAVVTARVTLPVLAPAGTNQLFTAAQSVEYMQCSFGHTFYARHLTQVTLQRYPGAFSWVGTVTSTFNQ